MNPRIVSVTTSHPKHYVTQEEVIAGYSSLEFLTPIQKQLIARVFRNAQIDGRHFALTLFDYPKLSGFKMRNELFLENALTLGKNSLEHLFRNTDIQPDSIGLFASSTVTGISVPSLDAKLMNILPFHARTKRLPLFGLGCLAGCAGVNRVADYLRGHPKEAAVFMAVEVCSLTWNMQNIELAHLISSAIFGDGCASVLMVGPEHPLYESGVIEVLDGDSYFFHDTERVMGFDIDPEGLKVVLSAEVPELVTKHMPRLSTEFLARHGLDKHALEFYVAHPGGPKVLQALAAALQVDEKEFRYSWSCLKKFGNMSSVSVLVTLAETLKHGLSKDALGLMSAMGPAFCAELSLLKYVAT